MIQKLLKEEHDLDLIFGAALSGSKNTLVYLMQIFTKTDATIEVNGRNVLHYAAMSGSLETLQYVIQNMKIPVDKNTFIWAAWSSLNYFHV